MLLLDITFNWERLLDSAISLSILAIITKVLWERLKRVEDKMDKYLEEDRKEMLEVIKDNTRAFEKLTDKL